MRWSYLVGLIGAFAYTSARGDTWSGEVVKVRDGDTITVVRDETRVRVRLRGIDAPEKGQPFGRDARQLTSKLVLGKQVRVTTGASEKDQPVVAEVRFKKPESIEVLRGDRIAHRKVIVSTSLSRELVKAGLAWWCRECVPKEKELASVEAQAKKARRGLWARSGATPIPPWEWRRGKRSSRPSRGK